MAMDEDDNVAELEEEAKQAKSIIGKRLIFILIGLLMTIILIVLAALYFTGVLDDLINPEPQTLEEAAAMRGDNAEDIGYFYPLDEFSVVVQSSSSRPRSLTLKLILELEAESDKLFIDQLLPRVMDSFQVFIRDLRVNELEGSMGIYRVREELLRRINAAISPIKIRDVLFENIAIN